MGIISCKKELSGSQNIFMWKNNLNDWSKEGEEEGKMIENRCSTPIERVTNGLALRYN